MLATPLLDGEDQFSDPENRPHDAPRLLNKRS